MKCSLTVAMVASALCVIAGRPPTAHAVLPVVDAASIVQVGLQLAQTKAQFDAMQSQLNRLRMDARRLDPRSFRRVTAILNRQSQQQSVTRAEFAQLDIRLDQVNSIYRRLNPAQQQLQGISPEQRAAHAEQMHQQLSEASRQAIVAQSSLRKLEDTTEATNELLSQSAGSDSQVAQLQIATQLIGLMGQTVRDMVSMLAKSGRVASTTVAQQLTERRLSSERHRQMMRGYNRGQGGLQSDPMSGYLRSGSIPEVRRSRGR